MFSSTVLETNISNSFFSVPNTTLEHLSTRPAIITTPSTEFIESCIGPNQDIVFWVIVFYGIIGSLYTFFKAARAYHNFNMQQNPEYLNLLFCSRILYFFKDSMDKRNIFIILILHVWNQATDIGVIVEMYYISFSAECTLDQTLLYRLFGVGLAFMIFYRLVTSILAIYATQKPSDFFYQLFDLLLIRSLEYNYIFESLSIDEVQTWIIYTSCTLQSFPIMIISVGIMTLTQGFHEHPLLLLSFVLSFILITYSIITNDRIIYHNYAQNFAFNRRDIFGYSLNCRFREIVTGYCFYCDGFKLPFIWRSLFRIFDFQFRIFLLNFIWTAIGGAYLAAYLLFEFLFLWWRARKIQRYQILSGLLGIVINYTSKQARKFTKKFAIYRFITNYLLLIIVAVAVNYPSMQLPISDPYERRRADFTQQSQIFNLYIYLCVLSVLNPWLYYGAIHGGDLIRDDDDAFTNPRDPHCLIANRDLQTFTQLIVFGNKFHHGNEWVLQGIINEFGVDIFNLLPKYWMLLMKSYNWDYSKISYYTKATYFAAVIRLSLKHNNLKLARLLFESMGSDIRGIESGLLYWCNSTRRGVKTTNITFLRIIKLINTKFGINKFGVATQSALLKYCILRAAKVGDLAPFHAILKYDLSPTTLSHLYLHYAEFTINPSAKTEWNIDIFSNILYTLHHVRTLKFNVDNHTAKTFLYWSLKFECWETVNELLLHQHHQKQIYSKYDQTTGNPFLHLVCNTICDYEKDDDKIKTNNICKIAHKCINKLYTPLNEKNKLKITPLMYACYQLNLPLIQTILRFGPDIDEKDKNENDCFWYIDNNYYIDLKKRKKEKQPNKGRTSNVNVVDQLLSSTDADVDEGENKYNDDDDDHKLQKDIELTQLLTTKSSKNNNNNEFDNDIDDDVIKKRRKEAIKLIKYSLKKSVEDEDFIDDYEERYDEFFAVNESISLYRSNETDHSSLFNAIIKNDFGKLIDLIDNKHLDTNLPTIDGTTPLHFACEYSGALVIKFLMDRGAYVFGIQYGMQFPINMMKANNKIDDNERDFMMRLLDVKDVDHDPFAMTDERIVEVERIQLFMNLFLRFLIILFCIYFTSFLVSAFLNDFFNVGYGVIGSDWGNI